MALFKKLPDTDIKCKVIFGFKYPVFVFEMILFYTDTDVVFLIASRITFV